MYLVDFNKLLGISYSRNIHLSYIKFTTRTLLNDQIGITIAYMVDPTHSIGELCLISKDDITVSSLFGLLFYYQILIAT